MSDQPCTDCIHDGQEVDIDLKSWGEEIYDANENLITRRDFGRNVARFGFVTAVALVLGLRTVNDAVAITCSCGPVIAYGTHQCEQMTCNGGPHNTGRSRYTIRKRYPTGTAGYCGEQCVYYSPWACYGICNPYPCASLCG
jgi:hypothetical protein